MKRKGIKMKTTRETADKVIDEISKVSSNFDFLCCAVAPLKTEEESLFFLDSLKRYKPDSEARIIIMSLTIIDARNKAGGKEDYLSKIKFPK